MRLTRAQARLLLGDVAADFSVYANLEPVDASELQIRLEDFILTLDTDAALRAELEGLKSEVERLKAEMGYHEAKDVIEQLTAQMTDLTAQLAARTQERDETEKRYLDAVRSQIELRQQLAAQAVRIKELEEK